MAINSKAFPNESLTAVLAVADTTITEITIPKYATHLTIWADEGWNFHGVDGLAADGTTAVRGAALLRAADDPGALSNIPVHSGNSVWVAGTVSPAFRLIWDRAV